MMKLLFYKICCNSWPPKTLKKNHLKTNNQPETKKIFENLQGKKTHIINFTHHMEYFDIKINCFYG